MMNAKMLADLVGCSMTVVYKVILLYGTPVAERTGRNRERWFSEEDFTSHYRDYREKAEANLLASRDTGLEFFYFAPPKKSGLGYRRPACSYDDPCMFCQHDRLRRCDTYKTATTCYNLLIHRMPIKPMQGMASPSSCDPGASSQGLEAIGGTE